MTGSSTASPREFRSARWNCNPLDASKTFPERPLSCARRIFRTSPPGLADWVVPQGQIVDLSSKMDSDGRLTWDVPAGKWTVLRIGHTSTGKAIIPRLSKAWAWNATSSARKPSRCSSPILLGKLLEDQAAVGGKALTMTHIDSWEVGSQNWTPGFREEFQKRCGYDLHSLSARPHRAGGGEPRSHRALPVGPAADRGRSSAGKLRRAHAGNLQSAWADAVD